jgi:hypothetical protein
MHGNAQVVAALVAVLGLGGCGDNVKLDGPLEDELSPTLSLIEQDVFAASCVAGACHGGNAPAAALDLRPGRSCEALIEAPSCLFTELRLVVPWSPEESFLLAKLEGVLPEQPPDGPCRVRTNQPMPYNARPLPPERIDQVREWIALGASCADAD